MRKVAIFPGSFDPFTNGHLETVRRAAGLFDDLIVAVMTNTNKRALFTPAERVALIEDCLVGLPNVHVQAHAAALTVDLARELGAQYIVRGLRNASDYTFETEIAHANAKMAPEITTILLPARGSEVGISSSVVKEIASFGGDLSDFVPAGVARALEAKFGGAHETSL